jgi:hypothetical protein
MNQSYGRLVSRAAIAATVMASALLIKIFAGGIPVRSVFWRRWWIRWWILPPR